MLAWNAGESCSARRAQGYPPSPDHRPHALTKWFVVIERRWVIRRRELRCEWLRVCAATPRGNPRNQVRTNRHASV